MEGIPGYVWSIVSLIFSGVGAWVGVKITVTKLEVEMKRALADLKSHERYLGRYGEDLLTHDMELEQILNKLQLKRARRQPLRGWLQDGE